MTTTLPDPTIDTQRQACECCISAAASWAVRLVGPPDTEFEPGEMEFHVCGRCLPADLAPAWRHLLLLASTQGDPEEIRP